MTRHAEVHHADWIGAPVDLVRRQFADLDHHIAENVHPKLRFEILERGERRARYAQEVRLLGIRQRDVFGALFARPIGSEPNLLGLATGESVACINHLLRRGEAVVDRVENGVAWYRAA